jgi:predicted DNA-binding transcriptional regulator YafY
VWEGHRVQVAYARGDETVERVLDPLGLVLKGGIWYVVASVEGQVRTYRISRVVAATALEDRFDRPPAFDLAEFWAESIATYEREAPRVEVSVRVDPRYLQRLADYVGEQTMEAAEHLDGADPDGWIRLRLRVDWPRDAPGHLLGMGAHLEVIDPPEIRARVATMARAAAALYPASESEPAATPA